MLTIVRPKLAAKEPVAKNLGHRKPRPARRAGKNPDPLTLPATRALLRPTTDLHPANVPRPMTLADRPPNRNAKGVVKATGSGPRKGPVTERPKIHAGRQPRLLAKESEHQPEPVTRPVQNASQPRGDLPNRGGSRNGVAANATDGKRHVAKVHATRHPLVVARNPVTAPKTVGTAKRGRGEIGIPQRPMHASPIAGTILRVKAPHVTRVRTRPVPLPTCRDKGIVSASCGNHQKLLPAVARPGNRRKRLPAGAKPGIKKVAPRNAAGERPAPLPAPVVNVLLRMRVPAKAPVHAKDASNLHPARHAATRHRKTATPVRLVRPLNGRHATAVGVKRAGEVTADVRTMRVKTAPAIVTHARTTHAIAAPPVAMQLRKDADNVSLRARELKLPPGRPPRWLLHLCTS